MRQEPVYRRRRRVVAVLAVLVACGGLWLAGPDDGVDGNDPCHLTPNTPTCRLAGG